MVLGELKAIGEDPPEDNSLGLFLFGLATGWLIILSVRGAHKYRKEFWHYDEASEPHWPGDKR